MAKKPFSPAMQLDHAISSIRLSHEASDIFMDYPALRTMALAYTRYVSPIIDLDDSGTNLLPLAIKRAILSVIQHGNPHHFLGALIEASRVLAKLKITVPNQDTNLWDIWDYDEPLIRWMMVRDSSKIRIALRDLPLDEGLVVLKMLHNIASVRDIKDAHIRIDIRATSPAI